MSAPHPAPGSGLRRLAAFGLDYAVMAAYIGLLTAVSLGLQQSLGFATPAHLSLVERLAAQAGAFLALTLPVVLYFAVCEWSRWQGTPGKRAVGLRVVALDGSKLPFRRTLGRSLVKFAPWEVAHTALWHLPGWPLAPEPTALSWLVLAAAQALALTYVLMLFMRSRRPLYDRVAASMVVRRLA